MALSPKLDFRQSQSLVMTPQLMQSIKLLQMTHIELSQFLEQEIEKNPLLDPADSENLDFSEERPESEDEKGDLSGDEDWFKTDAIDDAETLSSTFDSSLENIFPDDPAERFHAHIEGQRGTQTSSHAFLDDDDIDQMAEDRPSLSAHIAEQIALSFSNGVERLIAIALADALDENGYLRADHVALSQKLGVEPRSVEKVLQVLQSFDPPGVFARDLRECLTIQLEQKNLLTPAMTSLIDNLDLLGRRDFAALKKICGVEHAMILRMLREIQTLDPKPGALFEISVADAIIPDILVTLTREGDWAIELNPAALPRVIVNNRYYARVRKSATDEDKVFLTESMQSARWLIRSLDQRARTILKVAQEIIKHQDPFLRKGVSFLKPLKLRAIANAVSMHESTISRVIAGKFIATPRGVFELRYFFTGAIASVTGESAHAAESVRHLIRQMIDTEKPDQVLSDDAIVKILKEDGVDIARRTVAKYRESMNIASSVQRRREKRAATGHNN